MIDIKSTSELLHLCVGKPYHMEKQKEKCCNSKQRKGGVQSNG